MASNWYNWKEILDNLEKVKHETLTSNSRVLIVDATNIFISCFSVINHTNREATPIGGITGFLKSLGFAIKILNPTKIIVVFDGQGSTTNKRYLYPEYKANRNNRIILNWTFKTKEEEQESMVSQIVRLIEYLELLPVHLLSIDKVEADDVIGYLTGKLPGKVVIMSGDSDFMQLVSDGKVEVYAPIKKIIHKEENVKNHYKVYPSNFALYKTLLGDKSDNIPKIRGFGPDKMLKLIPGMQDKKGMTLEECLKRVDPTDKWGEKLLAFKNQLEINYKLIDLVNPTIPESELEEIHKTIDNPTPNFDKNTFMQMYGKDMLGDSIPNLEKWLDKWSYLTAFK